MLKNIITYIMAIILFPLMLVSVIGVPIVYLSSLYQAGVTPPQMLLGTFAFALIVKGISTYIGKSRTQKEIELLEGLIFLRERFGIKVNPLRERVTLIMDKHNASGMKIAKSIKNLASL